MNQEPALIRQRMKTPHAAAIAGIIFSLLFITSLLLIWVSIPDNPLGPATEVISHLKTISFSLNLLPFAGIAFLWFIAVVRDRLGELEDRFFATVFLGSGLLFIAMVFSAATCRRDHQNLRKWIGNPDAARRALRIDVLTVNTICEEGQFVKQEHAMPWSVRISFVALPTHNIRSGRSRQLQHTCSGLIRTIPDGTNS